MQPLRASKPSLKGDRRSAKRERSRSAQRSPPPGRRNQQTELRNRSHSAVRAAIRVDAQQQLAGLHPWIGFPRDQFPDDMTSGDEMLLYAVGGYKKVFVICMAAAANLGGEGMAQTAAIASAIVNGLAVSLRN
jgi:small-conductance mechanosensitive channel